MCFVCECLSLIFAMKYYKDARSCGSLCLCVYDSDSDSDSDYDISDSVSHSDSDSASHSDSNSDVSIEYNSPSSYRQPLGNGQSLSRRYCTHSERLFSCANCTAREFHGALAVSRKYLKQSK